MRSRKYYYQCVAECGCCERYMVFVPATDVEAARRIVRELYVRLYDNIPFSVACKKISKKEYEYYKSEKDRYNIYE